MPTYPFHTTHVEYLAGHPTFDVRKTPSAIGLLPEMLRRTKGAHRSLDPDFCVSALGPDAERIAGDAPANGDPFGADSTYHRMLACDTTFVGLGVSLNTCSFIHAIDSRCASGYPAAVYESAAFDLTVIDVEGQARSVSRKALRPEFQRLTAPSSVIDVMKPDEDTFTTIEINGARFFRWRLAPWASWCEAHAAEQRRAGAWPCWLSRLSGHVK
jgi:aminoglycoside 3-N-acetyltransferase